MSNSRQITIVDVAKEAGVSFSTVSRVLNNEDHVKPEKREKVLRTIARLGYTANVQARSLRGGRTHVIGLLVRDLGTAYIGEVIRGIDSRLADAQYDLMLYTTHRRKMQVHAYVATLTRGMADGLLLVLPRNPEGYLESLRERRFPFVLIDHQGIDNEGPAVGAQNLQGGYTATRYLLELGHRRSGMILGHMEMGCARDRLDGYHMALKEFGVTADPTLIVHGEFDQPSGYAAATALLAQPTPPTAIFASNDVMAFGAMEAARAHGLHIPDDISIVGFDDVPQAEQVNPPLTTVRQPLKEMGSHAAQMLLEIIGNPERPAKKIELPTELVVRASTKRLS
jgi:LacI family transcriptional regulator